jgi:hypothetical protein
MDDTASMSTAMYNYTTLNTPHSFRLLRFDTSSVISDGICFAIEEYDRTNPDCPAYTALSYAWGDASVKEQIKLDEIPIPITANLHEALAHLKEMFPDIIIWIDAVCIDQDDPQERGHQVAQMGKIYSNAENVISWLGPGSEEIGRLFSVMTNNYITQLPGTMKHVCFERYNLSAVYKAFQDLTSRKYWARLWTVQEMVLATTLTLMCGEDTVQWYVFVAFLGQVAIETMWMHQTQVRQIMAIYLLRLHRKSLDLAFIVPATRDKIATDPRDYIYGILGLVTLGAGQKIQADYTISQCALYRRALYAMYTDWMAQNPPVSAEKRLTFLSRVRECLTFKDQFTQAGTGTNSFQCLETVRFREDLFQHYPDQDPLPCKTVSQPVCHDKECPLYKVLVNLSKTVALYPLSRGPARATQQD